MTFKIDHLDSHVLEWSLTEDGAHPTTVEDYTPTIYVSAGTDYSLSDIRPFTAGLIGVVETGVEEWRTGFRHDPETVLRVDIDGIDAVTQVAQYIFEKGEPGAFKLYNVDLSREFRYCLERGISPVPLRTLSRLRIEVPPTELADPPIHQLTIDGTPIDGDPQRILQTAANRIALDDPDVLILSDSRIIPTLYRMADEIGVAIELGRRPGWQQLAAQSTYESYGRVGNSPARYNLPGRAIIDLSNTFLYHEGGLPGLLDLVERSSKPLQEASWGSIGNILTAIQIREAIDRGVLVPWNSWRHEFFKTANQLHEADRGGYIFAPEVGFHENVHELDFSALYPNIMVTRNVSPETIRCDCHSDREDVPGLGYSICDEQGYLPDVLRPLIEARDELKAKLKETDDEKRRQELEGRSDALKWILVSCFGYQGFSNAKFGRIEAHEAINAFAREILLDAKERLEAGGWRLVHGIVDSLWVTPQPGAPQESLHEIAEELSEEIGIRLEYEDRFDWCAFVPMKDSNAGALTKYFGKKSDGDGFKYRGIEVRQRSTPEFISEAQKELIHVLDQRRDVEAVCDRVQRFVVELTAGRVNPEKLLIKNRVSKRVEEYTQYTRSVAALERADDIGLDKQPGQNVSYLVVDDDKQSRERVKLSHEALDKYDARFYRELLIQAAESVVSPLGWHHADIEEYLAEHHDTSLTAFQ